MVGFIKRVFASFGCLFLKLNAQWLPECVDLLLDSSEVVN
jgi:hypothetical protein